MNSRGIADRVIFLIASLGIVHLFYAMFAGGLPGTVVSWARGESDPPGATLDRATDALMRDAMREPHNVVLSVSGNSGRVDPEVLLRFYARATYMHWPKRLYAAHPGAIVLSGDDLLSSQAPSDRTWLAHHDVRVKLRVQLDRPSVEFTPVER